MKAKKINPKYKGPNTNRAVSKLSNRLLIISGILIIAVFYLIFQNFFPNSHGELGHDYSLALPQFLDGAFWYKTNGLFEVPWFTPSFGGGLPNFPNPVWMYYSIPQFLSFAINPITSIKLTLLIFGIIGFCGFYLFLRRIFNVSQITALLGGTLFLFNGFYAHRMIIGHIIFHSYMLFPLFLYIVFHETKTQERINLKRLITDLCIGAIIIAYILYTGAWYIILPLMLVVFICLIIYNLVNSSYKYVYPLLKLVLVLILGITLAAAKLNASLSFLALFPRDLYPIPGIASIADLIRLSFLSLFGTPDADFANKITVNRLFLLEQHEYEFGVGIVPLIIISFGLVFLLYKVFTQKYFNQINLKRIAGIVLLLLLLSIPLALNYFTPTWNEFLKTVPFVRNSSTNVRWFSAYIPVLVLLTCIIIEKVSYLSRNKYYIVIGSILVVLFTNITRDRTFYNNQQYNPKVILRAYNNLEAGRLKPEITSINTRITMSDDNIIGGNDLMAVGCSQLFPYEPIFGYRLEKFPKKTLTIGPVMQLDSGGVLNIKNPASYVFPKENNCSPGDQFTINQKEDAEKFSKYLPFPFSISPRQKIADYLTIISLAALIIYLLFNYFVIIFPGKSK